VQEYSPEVTCEVVVEEVSDQNEEALASVIEKKATSYQGTLDIEKGRLVRMVLFKTSARHNRLLMVIHHLVVDGVSWRILLEDLELLLGGNSLGANKSSSYRQWYQALVSYSQSRRLQQQRLYWEGMVRQYQPLRVDRGEGLAVIKKEMGRCAVGLNEARTRELLQEVPRVYHTEINDILLSALALTLEVWSKGAGVIIGLEGHGREEIGVGADLSRTVGWFTSLYPVRLHSGGHGPGGAVIKQIKEQLRQVPDKGIGFGVLKYLGKLEGLQGKSPWDIVFNYLGRADNVLGGSSSLVEVEGSAGESISGDYEPEEKLSVNAMIAGGELVMQWSYSSRHYQAATIQQLAKEYIENLEALIVHCMEQGIKGVAYTPSDYGLHREVSHEELDEFLSDRNQGMINIIEF
jgi:non-ribosomal peptide synthase protein (TIGR01720 family)